MFSEKEVTHAGIRTSVLSKQEEWGSGEQVRATVLVPGDKACFAVVEGNGDLWRFNCELRAKSRQTFPGLV